MPLTSQHSDDTDALPSSVELPSSIRAKAKAKAVALPLPATSQSAESSSQAPLVASKLPSIEHIEAADRQELSSLWKRLLNESPPAKTSIIMMQRVLCFEVQVRRQGGVDRTTKRRLAMVVKSKGLAADLNGNQDGGAERPVIGGAEINTEPAAPQVVDGQPGQEPEASSGAKMKTTPKQSSRKLKPGGRLLREWEGRTYQVDVIDGGFIYAGARYRSLSAIAKLITGAHWSGPRFFGLAAKPRSKQRLQNSARSGVRADRLPGSAATSAKAGIAAISPASVTEVAQRLAEGPIELATSGATS